VLKIYNIETEYVEYLHSFDSKVRISDKHDSSILRPFTGVVLELKDYKYFAPLSSPKARFKYMQNSLDFFKITKKGETLGAIDINNMIPVYDSLLYEIETRIIDTDSSRERGYKFLVMDELSSLNNPRNQRLIIGNAKKVYAIKTTSETFHNSPKFIESLKARCCNFKLSEIISS
jgi:protein AbiQ